MEATLWMVALLLAEAVGAAAAERDVLDCAVCLRPAEQWWRPGRKPNCGARARPAHGVNIGAEGEKAMTSCDDAARSSAAAAGAARGDLMAARVLECSSENEQMI